MGSSELTLSEIAHLLGEKEHRLIYLCEKGVVVPDIEDARGRGSSRLFSKRNVLEFAVALKLREALLPARAAAAVVHGRTVAGLQPCWQLLRGSPSRSCSSTISPGWRATTISCCRFSRSFASTACGWSPLPMVSIARMKKRRSESKSEGFSTSSSFATCGRRRFGARSDRRSADSSSEKGLSDTSRFRSASCAWTRKAGRVPTGMG